ncbi:MAG: MFS transporter [Planctomycetota bacterium]
MEQTLTEGQKKLLFWASFLALAACGVNFAFRIAKMGDYGTEFELSGQQIGNIIGSCFWPIAITMILFSLVVDKTGYRWPMFGAAALMIASGLGTYFATSYEMLLLAAISIGLGHGIVEAVINPACAAAYPKNKTKMLTILHAAWPAGVVGGTLVVIAADKLAGGDGMYWRYHALWLVLPAAIFGLLHIPAKFPVDERVQAGVPFKDMLKEVGFMGMALAGFMLFYQIGGEVLSGIFGLFEIKDQATWFYISLGAGVVIGGVFGIAVGSLGKPLFFLLCLLMIPVATAELSTDGWIKELMNPVLGEYAVWAIVFSAGVMFLLRMFAGGVLKIFNPPMLMATSGVLSAAGLYWLGTGAVGWMIFIAFFIYAVGQTYYWPCILGFVAERFPRGGALTLNLVSAMALLSLGIVGNPILGVARDKSVYDQSQDEQVEQFVEVTQKKAPYLWMKNDVIDATQFPAYGATQVAGEGEAILASLKPKIEGDKLTAKVAELKTTLDEQAADEDTAARWAELGISRTDLEAVKTYQLVKGSVTEAAEDDEAKAAASEELVAALPEESKDGIEAFNDSVAKHGELTVNAGRDVLVFAAIFPGILVVCFAAIALYFRSIGGYKPIELLKDDPETTKDHVTEAPGSEM